MMSFDQYQKHLNACRAVISKLSRCYSLPFTGLKLVRERDLRDLINLALFPEDTEGPRIVRTLKVIK